jgi:hypothetical protein
VYKIMCETNCCNCFYIGKSQRYVKKQVQEHIGEVARLYGKLILPTNQSQKPCAARPLNHGYQQPIWSSSPSTHKQIQSTKNASNRPREAPTRTLMITNADASSITADREDEPSRNSVDFCPIKAPHHPPDPRQENYSALARHLLSHIRHIRFNLTSDVREWCRSHISIDILWKSNSISLMNTVCTKLCRLCTAEQMTIGHNFVHSERCKKIINLKTDSMRGACTCT